MDLRVNVCDDCYLLLAYEFVFVFNKLISC